MSTRNIRRQAACLGRAVPAVVVDLHVPALGLDNLELWEDFVRVVDLINGKYAARGSSIA